MIVELKVGKKYKLINVSGYLNSHPLNSKLYNKYFTNNMVLIEYTEFNNGYIRNEDASIISEGEYTFFEEVEEVTEDDKTKVKLLIIGEGRHGKDTVAEYLRDNFSYKFSSSSMFAAKRFVYESLKNVLNYETFEECYNDRHNWRELWYQLIKAYNSKNPSRLAEEMLNEGNDIYVGMRDDIELQHCLDNKLFDLIIWVGAEERLGKTESEGSIKINKNDADIVINNNGTLEELHVKIKKLMELIL